MRQALGARLLEGTRLTETQDLPVKYVNARYMYVFPPKKFRFFSRYFFLSTARLFVLVQTATTGMTILLL